MQFPDAMETMAISPLAPQAPPLSSRQNVRPNSIVVNTRSEIDKRIIACMRNVTIDYAHDIKPDFIMNTHACGIYLSISFHLIHPLIAQRKMKELGKDFRVRVCLIYVDIPDSEQALLELNKLCFNNEFTLILTWSHLETARYIETFKCYESKSSTSIQEKVETGFAPNLTNVLTSVRSINKTDVTTLMSSFDNFRGICKAEEHHLILCPGIGEKKVKRLYQILHQPLKKRTKLHDNLK